MEVILGIIATEALVQLWFHAAPLQYVRWIMIFLTPFLYSSSQDTHLLDCRYCVSVWAGILVAACYFYMDSQIYLFIVLALSFHRLSNFLHLIFSLMRDRQLDIRVNRR